MSLLADPYFLINDRNPAFTFIGGATGIASIEAVEKLLAACQSHLANLTQEKIDAQVLEWKASGHWPLMAHHESVKSPAAVAMPAAVAPTGSLYIMQNKRNGYVKLGYSINPRFREATLQSEEPDVELLATCPGTFKMEKHMHARFSEHRLRGEWFILSQKDIDAIIQEFENITTAGLEAALQQLRTRIEMIPRNAQ